MADVGRPPFYSNPDELQDKIHEYFTTGVKVRKVVVGKAPNTQVIELQIPTITGLCIYAGFDSRQSFYDYEEKPEFAYIIKRARLFIENEYEELLQSGNVTGAIFALKNMGWIDSQSHDHTTKGEKIQSIPIATWGASDGDSKES